jgi:LacI family transcriptional regulator
LGTTLKDIANACGMDVSTVSRALRDDCRVKPETREYIRKLAEQLGYSPNLAARSLVAGKSGVIWFLLPSLSNPLEQEPAQFASTLFREHGYDQLVAIHHHDPEVYRRLVGRLNQGVADGAIIIPGPLGSTEVFRGLIERNYPIVFLDRYEETLKIPAVINDNPACVERLVSLCLDEGATDFIIKFSERDPVGRSRRNSIVAFMEKLNLPYQEVRDGETSDNLELSSGKTAIIANSQSLVQGLINHSPEKFKDRDLVFGVFDFWYGEPNPAAKAFVCVQDFQKMAALAVELLQGMIHGRKKLSCKQISVPPLEFKTIVRNF